MTNLLILLSCLSMIESNDNDHQIGKKGEVSRYQILPAIWNDYNKAHGFDPDWHYSAFVIAHQITSERVSQFTAKFHREPTPLEIYVLWNAPTQAMKGKISKRVMERAKRFENLYRAKVGELHQSAPLKK